jgi:hypothetical protein
MGKKIKKLAVQGLNPYGSAARAVAPSSVKNYVDPMGTVLGMGQGGGDGIGFNESGYSDIEARSGIRAPKFESMRDAATGQLKDIYKYDPTKSEAFSQIRGQALSSGPSAWAQMQTQKLGLEQQAAMDMANKQGLQAMNQGNAMLARTGGLSSGAAGLAARANMKNQMLANQDINRQGIMNRLGISQSDEDRRQQMLGQVADAETSAQKTNLGALTGDIGQQRQFDLGRYSDQMAAWGAQNTAAAQNAAAAQTRKGKK